MWQQLFVLAYRYLRRRGLSHADAEDLAQDTLLVTFEHLDGVEPGKLHGWVRAVARNKHVDWARRHAQTAHAQTVLLAEIPDSSDTQDDPAVAAILSEDRNAVRCLLSSLPETDRRLLELKYLEDRTVEEVAEALGHSVNTAKVGLFRARKRLRAHIEKGRS
ncbi:MAG: sigma-70 family RNA polymerase sigma factor [Actinomycetota bacterium]|nr:sigma-70 family RNA polymerase sigma factor [Actinomycetota bacterium]